MTQKRFKTNINCSGCIARVTETLNNIAGKDNWEVDTTLADKILTINRTDINTEDIIKGVEHLGFNIEEYIIN